MRSGARDDGVQVVFDAALDGPAWPGPLAERAAAAGEVWLGPLGLIERLETELGLGGAYASRIERAAELAPALAQRPGFWTASLATDPVATCARLLTDRDLLAMWGWRGEPASARLAALAEATATALPGLPDRLARIIATLGRRGPPLASIRLVDAAAALPPLWKRLLAAAAAAGVVIEERPPVAAKAAGDLAHARAGAFTPTGDGSLTLLRPHGKVAAADEVAAALAALGSLAGVVVIGADAVLDAALARHGLPRAGADAPPPASAALAKLVIESAFTPMHPAELHALLCTDPGPVPRRLARALTHALGSFPGRGAPAWTEALADGLAALDDRARAPVAARLGQLLDPLAGRNDRVSLDRLRARLRALTTWARGRLENQPSLAEVVRVADGVIALAERIGADAFGRGELRRLCGQVERGEVAGEAAEAGLAAIRTPGAMLGPARIAIWWAFSREHAPYPPRLRLSEAERAALRDAGVTPPDAGAMMEAEARKWRRPLHLTSGALVLVCPRTTGAGEAAHPHPLWDELAAAMPDTRLAHRLCARTLRMPAAARRQPVPLRPTPVPADEIRAPQPLALRDTESPSSLERLLGCSLSWALHYPGRLRPGLSSGPADPGPLLYGSLAHEFLARIFGGGALRPDEAAARAEALFARELPRVCETLCLPDHQLERASLRRAVIESAREIGALLARTGAAVKGTEVAVAAAAGACTLAGKIDLLLADPDVVIDYKWGITSSRNRLASGAALQLAGYAAIARSGAKLPAVAYFLLKTQRVLAEPETCLADADCPGEATAAEMWQGAVAALAGRVAELADGELVAPGAADEPPESALAGSVMRIAPACEYCELSALCGRGGGT